ncbi:farnesol dehydrogenase-like isoform X2 [Bombus affinis]|uniref:farnesol dehydrogenase-like isoform X2 n=1 Tax=Bombus affinis TaxID=309941 RepID=UPI0021B71AB6|nr:farnesol dehydrogenase-like isoform X2 [Bombus affinis]
MPSAQLLCGMLTRMMNRWTGKVAVVTGSSGGIGLAISKALASHGIKIVGLGRRIVKLQDITAEIGKDKFFPIECDVTKEEDILKVFKWIDEKFGRLDILVNNAGVVCVKPIIDSKTEEYRKLIDTNLIAPAIFAREAVKSMKKRNACGHVINISSIAGLHLESIAIPLGMYGPSKYGLRALGIELRHEINAAKLNIKITNISPGAVITDMIRSIRNALHITDDYALKDADIAEAVIYALGTPETVEIPEITIISHGTGTSSNRQHN